MFATFTNSTINGAAPRRRIGMSSPLRLVYSNNNPSRHNPRESFGSKALRRAERPKLVSRWHVVASTGRLECSWSEQPSDGAALEPPKPGRRRGRVGHGATDRNRPPRRITRRAA